MNLPRPPGPDEVTLRRASCACTGAAAISPGARVLFWWVVRSADIGKPCDRCRVPLMDAGVPDSTQKGR